MLYCSSQCGAISIMRAVTHNLLQHACIYISCVLMFTCTFDQKDGEKDDGTMVKKDQVCCLKDGTHGVVSTASTTTSNPLPILYCYDIAGFE